MGFDTGLADRIRAKGVRVVEVAGWKTRGYLGQGFEADVALHHHTASGPKGATPSMSTCLYGRPDVPGPLIQVLQSREPDGDDIAYVLAAGKCNHTGRGVWRRISGNSRAGGVEVEHTGKSTVVARRREITCRILAALLEGPGASRDARNVCQHFEYATPKGRKPDFFNLAPDTPDSIRARVAYWIGRTATQVPQEDDVMDAADRAYVQTLISESERRIMAAIHGRVPVLIKGNGVRADGTRVDQAHAAKWWAVSAEGKRHITSRDEANHLIMSGQLRADVGNQPFPWAQDVIDQVDEVDAAGT